MDAFVTRKRRRYSGRSPTGEFDPAIRGTRDDDDESTEMKLAILASLHPAITQETLLDLLLAHDGAVQAVSHSLHEPVKESLRGVGFQTSLRSFAVAYGPSSSRKAMLRPTKGTTLHLYDARDIAEHTPCTIIYNFLPQGEANGLLEELLAESTTFEKITFKLFDNVVSSPHTSSFYVGNDEEVERQKNEYVYNGARLTDVREITPWLNKVKARVQEAVNGEIRERIRTCYPGGKKLKYQSPHPWTANAAFVNCYKGGQENVGWHSDQLTYLGPRAVIGSLSLGVAREFRVRRVLPVDMPNAAARENTCGQIAIHLPHNSLLVMHAEMQEEWKHSVAPAAAIDPHPIAGNRRINVTYRDYRSSFHPRTTPRCPCDVPCVMRVVQRKSENWGRYFWTCHAGNVPGQDGCHFFSWAEFDDDGNPIGKNSAGGGGQVSPSENRP